MKNKTLWIFLAIAAAVAVGYVVWKRKRPSTATAGGVAGGGSGLAEGYRQKIIAAANPPSYVLENAAARASGERAMSYKPAGDPVAALVEAIDQDWPDKPAEVSAKVWAVFEDYRKKLAA